MGPLHSCGPTPMGRQNRSAWSKGRLGCRERHVRVSGRAANGTFAAFNDPKVPFATPHLPRKVPFAAPEHMCRHTNTTLPPRDGGPPRCRGGWPGGGRWYIDYLGALPVSCPLTHQELVCAGEEAASWRPSSQSPR